MLAIRRTALLFVLLSCKAMADDETLWKWLSTGKSQNTRGADGRERTSSRPNTGQHSYQVYPSNYAFNRFFYNQKHNFQDLPWQQQWLLHQQSNPYSDLNIHFQNPYSIHTLTNGKSGNTNGEQGSQLYTDQYGGDSSEEIGVGEFNLNSQYGNVGGGSSEVTAEGKSQLSNKEGVSGAAGSNEQPESGGKTNNLRKIFKNIFNRRVNVSQNGFFPGDRSWYMYDYSGQLRPKKPGPNAKSASGETRSSGHRNGQAADHSDEDSSGETVGTGTESVNYKQFLNNLRTWYWKFRFGNSSSGIPLVNGGKPGLAVNKNDILQFYINYIVPGIRKLGKAGPGAGYINGDYLRFLLNLLFQSMKQSPREGNSAGQILDRVTGHGIDKNDGSQSDVHINTGSGSKGSKNGNGGAWEGYTNEDYLRLLINLLPWKAKPTDGEGNSAGQIIDGFTAPSIDKNRTFHYNITINMGSNGKESGYEYGLPGHMNASYLQFLLNQLPWLLKTSNVEEDSGTNLGTNKDVIIESNVNKNNNNNKEPGNDNGGAGNEEFIKFLLNMSNWTLEQVPATRKFTDEFKPTIPTNNVEVGKPSINRDKSVTSDMNIARETLGTTKPAVPRKTTEAIKYWTITSKPSPRLVTTSTPLRITVPTPVPTSKPIVPDICAGSDINNGVSYKQHWSECSKFIQCAFSPDGSTTVHLMTCADGTLWDQRTHSCKEAQLVDCSYDRCKIDGFERYPSSTSCQGYWVCHEGRSHGMCCPPKHAYDVIKGCVPDALCVDECLGTLTQKVCDKKEVQDKPLAYEEYVEGQGFTLLTCPEGSTYSSFACQCLSKNDMKSPDIDCRPELYIPFNGDIKDESGNNNYLQVDGVKEVDGAGYFDGKSLIRVPRFSNQDFGGTVIVKLRYKQESGKGATNIPQALLANGDCNQPSSMYLVTGQGKLAVGLQTGNGNTASVSVDSSQQSTGWMEAVLAVDKNTLTGGLNGISHQTLFTGTIQPSKCALQIGRGTEFAHFQGYMDDITVYMCKPKGF